jgi:hypothetical protein
MFLRLEDIPDSIPVVISFNEKDDLVYAPAASEIINMHIARRKLNSKNAPIIKIFWTNFRHGDTPDNREAILEIRNAIQANENFGFYIPGTDTTFSGTKP